MNASKKNNLTRRANQRHSFIIAQSDKRPLPRNSGLLNAVAAENPYQQLELRRLAAAPSGVTS
jgi:hypothetical protein